LGGNVEAVARIDSDCAAAALRHTPVQQRGQRRVDHILACAEALFAEVGFQRASTNAIAEKAKISIGSLYQFFDSKESILEAITARYLEQCALVIGEVLTQSGDEDFDVMLSAILDALVRVQERRPYFLQCLTLGRPQEATSGPVVKFRESVVHDVSVVLMRRGIAGGAKVLELKARICVDTLSALLPLVLYAHGRERVQVALEVKAMLIGYLEPSRKAGE
jgi:AcrR family transcriptional regulator